MKTILKTVTLTTLLSSSSLFGGGDIAPAVVPVPIVQADPNPFYVGVGLLWAGVSRDCSTAGCPDVRLKDSTWGGIIRAGWEYNQYVGIEGRALKATIDSDWGETTHYGIFLKPRYPVSEKVNIYGLLGYGHTEIDTDCTAIYDTYKYDGFSYGIGLEYDLSDTEDDRLEGTYDRPFDGHMDQERKWGLWIDYQNLMNNEGPANFKSNIVTFGITYDF
ncbi:MAG: porin family protein [Sulfurovum sp.]|uniref:porin family protein n=1 Tax=Sulfurovum sp. TaxID=1969726 RepID=UPI003C74A2D6